MAAKKATKKIKKAPVKRAQTAKKAVKKATKKVAKKAVKKTAPAKKIHREEGCS
jgi:hypothetical protein